MGSIGVIEAENLYELHVLYDYVKRKIFNSYLKYESLVNVDKSVLIQEKIRGQEYGLDIINDLRGNYITMVAKKKCEMRSGETDSAVIIQDSKLSKTAEKLGKKLRHIANLDVDVLVEKDSRIVLLEMNARFGGDIPLAMLQG